jgi:hypothetical protein
MKFKFVLAFLSLLFISSNLFSQVTTDTLLVAGDCDHCKQRIELTVDLPGVKFASWDNASQQLIIEYKPGKITLRQIADALIAAGHDTELGSADDKVYEKLPGCCHYNRLNPGQQNQKP